jgi:hypothetical protein
MHRLRALVLMLVLLGAASACRASDAPRPCSQVHVSPSIWRAANWRAGTSTESRNASAAQRLADDIVRCRILRGKTKPEVGALLGAPEERGRSPGSPGMSWDYVTGIDPRTRDDLTSLTVVFLRGRVVEASHYWGNHEISR